MGMPLTPDRRDETLSELTIKIMQEIADNHRTTVNVCPGLMAFGPIYKALERERRLSAENDAKLAELTGHLTNTPMLGGAKPVAAQPELRTA